MLRPSITLIHNKYTHMFMEREREVVTRHSQSYQETHEIYHDSLEYVVVIYS